VAALDSRLDALCDSLILDILDIRDMRTSRLHWLTELRAAKDSDRSFDCQVWCDWLDEEILWGLEWLHQAMSFALSCRQGRTAADACEGRAQEQPLSAPLLPLVAQLKVRRADWPDFRLAVEDDRCQRTLPAAPVA